MEKVRGEVKKSPSDKAKAVVPSLLDMARQDPELRDLLRLIHKTDCSEQVVALIADRIAAAQTIVH